MLAYLRHALVSLSLVFWFGCSTAVVRPQTPETPFHTTSVSVDGTTDDERLLLGEFPLAEKKPVLDGDTIKVQGLDASLRLLGIDTEETFKRKSEREAFEKGWESYLAEMRGDSPRPVKMATPAGMEAWEYAIAFFENVPKVRLERDHPLEIRDFYSRYLAYVFAWKDGRWVNYNVEVVREGWSPYYMKYGRSQRFHEEFKQAEAEARAARRGIWNDEVLHYPDYDERLVWWGARERFLTAFEARASGRNDHIVMTRANALESLRQKRGEPVVVLGLVGSVRRATEENKPSFVSLAHNRFEALNLVFFDEDVFETTNIAKQAGEYVVVTGTVTEYDGRLQLVIERPDQIELSGLGL